MIKMSPRSWRSRLLASSEATRSLDMPFEIYMMVICLIYGVGIIVGGPRPASIQAQLNPTLILVWGYLLLVGGTAALAGIMWLGRLTTALVMEQIGCIVIAGGTLIYSLSVVQTLGSTGGFAAALAIAFSAACLRRAWIVRGHIKSLVAISQARS